MSYPEEEIERDLQNFKTAMLLERPFYGDFLLKLPIRKDPHVGTACTDGRCIMWNPGFFSGLSPAQRHYVLMHEVFHVLLMHPSRGPGKVHRLWNIAADLVVNNMCDQLGTSLQQAGASSVLEMKRPPDGCFAQVDDDQTTEQLYALLLKDNESRSNKKGSFQIRKSYRYTKSQLDSVPPSAVEPDLIPGRLTAEERAALEEQIKSMIQEAAKHGQGFGASGSMPRELRLLLHLKSPDWRALLKQFLTEAQSDDTSYATPERKYLHMDLILPGHSLSDEGELESVWAFVDSSGSIGQDEMNRFLTELYRIVKEFQCEMNIAYWDTEVTDVYQRIRREKEVLKALPKHSGGTDINCVYRWIHEKKLRPLVSLILTDGYFGIPDPSLARALPRTNTILVLSSESESPVYQTIGRVTRLKNPGE